MLIRPVCGGVLGVLFCVCAQASIGYTQDELKALADIERQATMQPPTPELTQSIHTQQARSQSFIEDAKTQAQYWQDKRPTDSLSGVLDLPKATQNPNAAPTGVMVFVSLTMPTSSLKALLKQSEHWQVPLVIRGVLPDGFPATARRIQSLLQEGEREPINSGFAIAPEWFDSFDITEVPTFVAVKDGRCLPKQPCEVSDFDVVRGNVSLLNALEQLALGDNPDVIEPILRRSP